MKIPTTETRRLGLCVLFATPSASRPDVTHYTFCVTTEGARWVCTCEGYKFKGECRHIVSAKDGGLPKQLMDAIKGVWPDGD